MKILTILIFLNSIFVWSQENQSDLNKYFLKGKVKTIHSVIYDANVINDSLVVKGPKKVIKRFFFNNETFITFNEFGLVTEIQDNAKHEKNTYNDIDKLFITQYLDSNSNIFRKTIYKYDRTNRLKLELGYTRENQIDYKLMYKYKNGKITSQVEKYLDDKEKYSTKYKYDKTRNLIERVEYENDSITSIFKFKNDSLGRAIKVEEFNSKNVLIKTRTYEYNKNGLLTKILILNSKNILISKIEYTFDINKNLIEEKETFENYSTYKQYNLMGDEILYVDEFIKGDIKEFEYTYDKNNNWIKKVDYFNGTPIDIVEREIIYY